MPRTTEEELQRLEAEGVKSDRPIGTAYFFSYFGASPKESRAFGDALEEAGFADIGADTEGGDRYYLHFWSYTERLADPEELRAAAQLASEIADRHGATLNGWEVSRLRDGTLRPVRGEIDRALLRAYDLGMDKAGWTQQVMEEADRLLPTLLAAGYAAVDDETRTTYGWRFTGLGVARIKELRPEEDDEE